MLRAVAELRVGPSTAAGVTCLEVASTASAIRSRSRAFPSALSLQRVSTGKYWRLDSRAAAILASIAPASTGYLPIGESPESMTQSVPSREHRQESKEVSAGEGADLPGAGQTGRHEYDVTTSYAGVGGIPVLQGQVFAFGFIFPAAPSPVRQLRRRSLWKRRFRPSGSAGTGFGER